MLQTFCEGNSPVIGGLHSQQASNAMTSSSYDPGEGILKWNWARTFQKKTMIIRLRIEDIPVEIQVPVSI